jgi:hypothetical protein
VPYFIETFDAPERQGIRRRFYQQHLEFLSEKSALLLACGAKLDDQGEHALGGVYLVDVDSRAEAELFIKGDPFHLNKLFQNVEITRWRKAYLGGMCFLS